MPADAATPAERIATIRGVNMLIFVCLSVLLLLLLAHYDLKLNGQQGPDKVVIHTS